MVCSLSLFTKPSWNNNIHCGWHAAKSTMLNKCFWNFISCYVTQIVNFPGKIWCTNIGYYKSYPRRTGCQNKMIWIEQAYCYIVINNVRTSLSLWAARSDRSVCVVSPSAGDISNGYFQIYKIPTSSSLCSLITRRIFSRNASNTQQWNLERRRYRILYYITVYHGPHQIIDFPIDL